MKKAPRRFLDFLRDQAVETAIALVTLSIILWGAVQGWLASFASWLTQLGFWPNWLVAGLAAAALVLLIAYGRLRARSRRRAPRVSPRQQFREVWGVLWGWPPPPGHVVGDGPLCPQHLLPLDVKMKDAYPGKRWFEFECVGLEGHKAHTIKGPQFSQVIPSDESLRDPSIYRDVGARLRAQDLERNRH